MVKYIEIDRAIETALLLLEEGEDEQTLAYNAALVAFVKNMEIAPAADIPRWIPVTERLPEESGEYLVVLDSLIYFSWFYKDDGVWSFKNADITAWMKLPDPYKVGEEE